jgi:peptide-methionine (S)-S-oxide reductase
VVGYSGGKKADPTYHFIMDHTEAVLIEFDPKVITYEDILLEWSQMHSPNRYRSNQYRSAIWYLNEEQKEAAEEIMTGMKAVSVKERTELFSDIEDATKFYRAEEYHQDFLSKRGSTKWM